MVPFALGAARVQPRALAARRSRALSGVKHAAYRALSRLHGPRTGPGLRVLMYHSVGGAVPGNPYGISIDPARFAEHMAALAASGWALKRFGAPEGGRELAVTFDDGFKDGLTVAAPLLQRLGIPMTVFVTAEHVRSPGSLYLSKTELRELARYALIGAHGDRHRALDALPDAELAAELSDSKRFLEDALGAPVETLSYPHGRVDRRVAQAARRAGYRLGGTSRYGLNGPDRDPLLLCRTEITAWDTTDDLRLKVDGRWDWFARRHPDPAGK